MVIGWVLCMVFECCNINLIEEFLLKLIFFCWIMYVWFDDVLVISFFMWKNLWKVIENRYCSKSLLKKFGIVNCRVLISLIKIEDVIGSL